MALTMIDAPPLGAVAQGVAGLWSIEARGFSPDGQLLLVKVVYSDDAFPLLPTRTAFWTYDLALGQYRACINDLIASDRSLEVTDVTIASNASGVQLVATYHETGASSGLDLNKLALIQDDVLIQGDLVTAITGNQADALISAAQTTANGRFVAIETAASNLANGLDTNELKDIYLLDLQLNSVRLVTSVGGAESTQDSLLGNVMSGTDGSVSVAFQSTQAFTTLDANAANDVFAWELTPTELATSGTGTNHLISQAAGGAAGAGNPLLTLNGVLFESASETFSTSDTNGVSDVWQHSGTSVTPVLVLGDATPTLETNLASSSDGGRYVAVTTATPELSGPADVAQLVIVDTQTHTSVVVSQSNAGALADDAVISPVLSANGTQVAFSSQASNLGAGAFDGFMHLYVSDLAVAPDATESGKAVNVQTYSWKAHTLLDGTSVAAGSVPLTQMTDTTGSTTFANVNDTVLTLTPSREIPSAEVTATASAVNLQDAIAILKMIVGLDVNGAQKPLSPYQTLAADFDGNGVVGLTDAIGVLKHVVGLTAPEPTWHFVNEADSSIPTKTTLSPGTPPSTVNADLGASASPVHVGLVGYLTGDADGSFAGASGSSALPITYFDALVADHNGLNLSQFGIY